MRIPVICTLFALFLLAPLMAQDPPHWSGQRDYLDCTNSCHTGLHGSGGGPALTGEDNVSLCMSCHNSSGTAKALTITPGMSAVPGVGGSSHAFGVPAENAARGAKTPSDQAMAVRLVGGNIVCSTCHNQHRSDSTLGGTPRITQPGDPLTLLGSTGTITSGGTYTGAEGYHYLIKIMQSGGQTKFGFSKDNGASYFPAGCSEGSANLCLTATGTVGLADGVEVTFDGGSYALGEQWEFSASWPFLRAALGDGGSNLCFECHSDWYMDHNTVQTEGWSTTSYRSHPVGITLNVNGQGYDRGTPLDGNGGVQGGGGDADPSNDLQLYGPGNTVECLTCHAVHHVDSQTNTPDVP